MKLLLVLARFDRHKWDSITDQAWNIARLLTASGEAQCVIAAARGKDEAALEVVQDVSIRRFTPQYPRWNFLRKKPAISCSDDNANQPGLEIFLRKNRFDLIHVMTPGKLCSIVSQVARELDIPCIVTCRSEEFKTFDAAAQKAGYSAATPNFSRVFNEYSAALKNVDRIFCTDHRLRRALAGELGDRQLIYWQPGVDCDYFARPSAVDFRKEYQLPADTALLMTVGQLATDKNQKMLLEIVSLLNRRGRKCKLLVLGWTAEQNYLEEFEEYVAEHKLGSVVKFIHGLPPGDERFRAAFQAASLVLLPSRYEVAASAVLEAWSAGVPVVASPAGSGGELITDGVNGRLAAVRYFQDWVKCCEEMLDERNRSVLEKMRSAARSEARKYRWQERLKELMEIYNEVITLKKCNNNQHNINREDCL